MIIGTYNITEMSDFDDVYLGIEVDPFIKVNETGGHFQFGLVSGSFEFEKRGKVIDFRWQGNDEMDEAWGTGKIEEKSDSEIFGVFTLNNGETYDFVATLNEE